MQAGTQLLESYGSVVVGPPGSGKSTYCAGIGEFMSQAGRRVAIVNLDPANDCAPYDAALDISELISLDDVMKECRLGPNGGLVYCIEFLEKNLDTWLFPSLDAIRARAARTTTYFMFDLPGQVELFTHHESLRRIVAALTARNFRLTCVQLIDAFHCSDPAKYISATMLSLLTMLRLELPQVNVLSKIDLVEKEGPLHFDIEFYARASNLHHLLPMLRSSARTRGRKGERTIFDDMKAAADAEEEESKRMNQPPRAVAQDKYERLNERMCELIEEFSLVSFTTLNIEDKFSAASVVKLVDKANGFAFVPVEEDEEDAEKFLTSM